MRARRVSLRWATAATKRWLTTKGATEVAEGVAAIAAPSRPGQAGAASASTAVAVGGAAAGALWLDLTHVSARADEFSDDGVAVESCMFTEQGESVASAAAATSGAEDEECAAPTYVQQ